jgi:hypothetical protein
MADTYQDQLRDLLKEIEDSQLGFEAKLDFKTRILTTQGLIAAQVQAASAQANLAKVVSTMQTYGLPVTLKTGQHYPIALKVTGLDTLKVSLQGAASYENPIRLDVTALPKQEDSHDGS